MNGNYSSFDEAFDMLLTEAAVKADENIGMNLNEPAEKPEFSAEHEQRMARLFEHERRKLLRRKIIKYSSRCACVLFAAVIVAATGIFSVDAWRASFLNFMSGVQKENTDYNFDDGENQYYFDGKLGIGYIPEGFEITKNTQIEESMFLKFENLKQYFDLIVSDINGDFSIDTEGEVIENLDLNGIEAIFAYRDNIKILIWNDNSYSYTLYGNIDKNELIKIGKSVKNDEKYQK